MQTERTTWVELVAMLSAIVGALVLVASIMAAWITHIIWSIEHLMAAEGATGGQMVLAALGTFFPPIGVIHGIMLWVA